MATADLPPIPAEQVQEARVTREDADAARARVEVLIRKVAAKERPPGSARRYRTRMVSTLTPEELADLTAEPREQ